MSAARNIDSREWVEARLSQLRQQQGDLAGEERRLRERLAEMIDNERQARIDDAGCHAIPVEMPSGQIVNGVEAIHGPWQQTSRYTRRRLVAAGIEGRLLVCFEESDTRGERHMRVLYGSAPVAVELAIKRFYLNRRS